MMIGPNVAVASAGLQQQQQQKQQHRQHEQHHQYATAFKTNVMNNDDNTYVVDVADDRRRANDDYERFDDGADDDNNNENDDDDDDDYAPPPPFPIARPKASRTATTAKSATATIAAAATEDANDSAASSRLAPSTCADISGLLQSTGTSAAVEKSLATMELQYFKAVSLYRRRNYEKCVEVCNAMLQAGHENNVQMFNAPPDEEDDEGGGGWSGLGGGGGGGYGYGSGQGGTDRAADLKNNSTANIKANMPHGGRAVVGTSGGHAGPIGGTSAAAAGIVSNNSSSGNIQRYGSNLQRIAAGQGGRQRGIYGNNAGSFSASSATTASTSSGHGGPGGGGGGGGGADGSIPPAGSLSIMPTWMMEGVWQLKMRALTQRIYIDDLETNDADDAVNAEVEFERIATTARPGTSIKTAFIPRPSTSTLRSATAVSRHGRTADNGVKRLITTGIGSRPTSGMARPGTSGLNRPGSSLGSRPASRCGTASRVRATSAAAFTIGDATAPLYQASRLNPTIYAERKVLVKALFQFLYYHEADVLKAYSLCEAVTEVHKQKRGSTASLRSLANCDEWWWQQQMGRCLLALKYPRKAEIHLQQSLANFPHPDTYVLLSRLYQRLEQTPKAMDLIQLAADKHPFDVTFRIEQGRLLDAMSQAEDSMQMYRLISRLNPINVEALACIAMNYFYDNNPEMALMYYRRILSLGVHSPELYCNIALCCLYGGQIDLVLPCFQRAILMSKTTEQKADVWYNLSFVALTTGDFNLARRCLQLCLTSDARNGAALNNLAVMAAHTGDILKAKSYLVAAQDVWQDSQEITANLKYMDEHYKL